MQVAAVRYCHCTQGLQKVTRPLLAIHNYRKYSNKPAYASPWVDKKESRALAFAKARNPKAEARPMLFGPIPDLVPNAEDTPQRIFGEYKEPEPPRPEPTTPVVVQAPPTFAPISTPRPPSHQIAPRDPEFTRQLAFTNITSMILRDTARSLGYQIVPDGFVRVSDVMRDEFYRDYDFKTFVDLCHDDPKDRFELSLLPDYIEGQLRDVWWVRARKEHTIPWVDCRSHRVLNMGKLQVVTCLCKVDDWDAIRRQGIREGAGHFVLMYRNLAGNIYKDFAIPRRTKFLCVTIDAEKAAQVGVMFFTTYDNQLLVVGNRDRVIPPETFCNSIVLEVNRKDLLAR